MTNWTFHNPVRVHFGEGVLDTLGAATGCRRYLLVTHPDAPLRPWRDRVSATAGAPALVVDEIEPNPSLAMLQAICTKLRQSAGSFDLIVALGGGSVMDTAKFVAAGHGDYASVIAEMEGSIKFGRRALPIIAIPTTAGTGSDMTRWATIWDPEQSRKLSLAREDLYASDVFVDPLVTASLPWSITLTSGLDALSHALESLWNVNASPMSRTLALGAARDLMAGLRRLHYDLSDAEARVLMAQGATAAGLAFSNTQTALAHNISYPITLDHKVPHGIACSFCLPDVMKAAIGTDAACDAALSALFGNLNAAPRLLRAFLDDLDVPATPEAFGIEAHEWRAIVEAGFAGPRGRNFIGSIERFPGLAAAPVATV